MTPSTPGPQPVSAYIPCFNNAATIGLAIQGIRNQTYPVDELFVLDDGSTDDSATIAEGLGVRVIRQGTNLGRGAARARAMETARHDFVLCCDATNRLTPNFLEGALKWFSKEEVVAVVGRWFDPNTRNVVDRWRARHLFQQELVHEIKHKCDLATYGAVVRKSVVLRIGNYDPHLRHGEDFELGIRLMDVGDTVFDPALEIEPVAHNTLVQVMERYTRWNRASIHKYSLSDFIDSHVVTWKILMPRDIKKRDWLAALITASVPYFSLAFADNKSIKPSTLPTTEGTAAHQAKP
jgi:glycosyltransferase involved in cell wall biosynthesis